MTRPVPDTSATNAHLRLALLQAATLLLATGAHAQSANCDKLRQTLSQRIEAGGVTGYGLDILPAKAPTPGGAKIIGTCDGGAYKAAYRRFASNAPDAAPAAEAPAPPPAPAPVPAPTPVALKPAPKSEPEPRPAPPPPAAVPAPAPAPVVKVAEPPPPPPPGPAPEPAPIVIAAAEPPPMAASATTPVSMAAEPAVSQPETPPRESMLRHGLALFTGDWRWLWALLLLPLVGWIWSWTMHRRQYDAAGLPRGPRL